MSPFCPPLLPAAQPGAPGHAATGAVVRRCRWPRQLDRCPALDVLPDAGPGGRVDAADQPCPSRPPQSACDPAEIEKVQPHETAACRAENTGNVRRESITEWHSGMTPFRCPNGASMGQGKHAINYHEA